MFNKKLKEEIRSLKRRVLDLENPPKFQKGDVVHFIFDSQIMEGKIENCYGAEYEEKNTNCGPFLGLTFRTYLVLVGENYYVLKDREISLKK